MGGQLFILRNLRREIVASTELGALDKEQGHTSTTHDINEEEFRSELVHSGARCHDGDDGEDLLIELRLAKWDEWGALPTTKTVHRMRHSGNAYLLLCRMCAPKWNPESGLRAMPHRASRETKGSHRRRSKVSAKRHTLDNGARPKRQPRNASSRVPKGPNVVGLSYVREQHDRGAERCSSRWQIFRDAGGCAPMYIYIYMERCNSIKAVLAQSTA